MFADSDYGDRARGAFVMQPPRRGALCSWIVRERKTWKSTGSTDSWGVRSRASTSATRIAFCIGLALLLPVPGHAADVKITRQHATAVEVNLLMPFFGYGEIQLRHFLNPRLEFEMSGGIIFGVQTSPSSITPFGYKPGLYGLTFSTGVNYYVANGLYVGIYAGFERVFAYSFSAVFDGKAQMFSHDSAIIIGAFPLVGYRWDFYRFFAIAEIGSGYNYEFPVGSIRSGTWRWGGGRLNLGMGVTL